MLKIYNIYINKIIQLNNFSALEPKLKKQKETPSNEPEISDTESDDLNEEGSSKAKYTAFKKEKISPLKSFFDVNILGKKQLHFY